MTQEPTPRRLLLVDDDDRSRRVLKRLLELEDFAVEPFSDAREALDCLRREPFHGLVTDHMMPGMTGVELVLAARALSPSLRCLVISGLGPTEEAERAQIAWLIKPANLADMVRLLA